MPELPEVETVRCKLESSIVGHTLISYDKFIPKVRYKVPHLGYLVGHKVISVKRVGRNLIIYFAKTSQRVLINLGMTGQIRLQETSQMRKHDVCSVQLEQNLFLFFSDIRRFGYILDTDIDSKLNALGIDAVDQNFNADYLVQYCKKTLPIKALLMDNKIVTGIGNIYASEILFQAGVLPYRRSCDVNLVPLPGIIKSILNKAITCGGTTVQNFLALGDTGAYQNHLQVYRQNKCSKCNTTIERKIIRGRSSYYCLNCQH